MAADVPCPRDSPTARNVCYPAYEQILSSVSYGSDVYVRERVVAQGSEEAFPAEAWLGGVIRRGVGEIRVSTDSVRHVTPQLLSVNSLLCGTTVPWRDKQGAPSRRHDDRVA